MSLQQDVDNLGTGSPYPYDRLLVRGVGTIDVVGTFAALDFPVAEWFQMAITPTGIALAVDGVGKGMIASLHIKTGFATYSSHRPADLSAIILEQDINTITLQKSGLPMTATSNDSHEKIVAAFVKALLTHFSQAVWDANATTIIRAIESESFVGGAATISLAFELNDLAWVHNDVTAPQVYIPGTGAYGSALPDGTEHGRFLLVSSALPASIVILVFTWVEVLGVWELTFTDTDFALIGSTFNPIGKTILFEGYYSTSPQIQVDEILDLGITTLLHESFYSSLPTIQVIDTYPALPYVLIGVSPLFLQFSWVDSQPSYQIHPGGLAINTSGANRRSVDITKFLHYASDSGTFQLWHYSSDYALYIGGALKNQNVNAVVLQYSDGVARVLKFEILITPVKRINLTVIPV